MVLGHETLESHQKKTTPKPFWGSFLGWFSRVSWWFGGILFGFMVGSLAVLWCFVSSCFVCLGPGPGFLERFCGGCVVFFLGFMVKRVSVF